MPDGLRSPCAAKTNEKLSGGRVLVTGAAGMLGSQLLLDAPGSCQAVGTDLGPALDGNPVVEFVGIDLTDESQVVDLFARERFTGVIHAAAYTAVDKAEEERHAARAVNARAPEVVAEACCAAGIPMVLISTDFIFDGTKGAPYLEDDTVAPLSVYGATKLEGEQRARIGHPLGLSIVRTQWLYGPRGNHFPGTMLRLAATNELLKVVDDQRGSPTSTLELSPAVWDVLALGARDESGVYHASCEGDGTWFDFARATFELAGLDIARVKPCTTEDFPRPAVRPKESVLDCSRLTALRSAPMLTWKQALARFFTLHMTS
jgi:dTDP-4-dehydrorhamnose reductase